MKLPKAYEPQQYESDIYALWEKSGLFSPHGTGKPYTVVVPPPNANGDLHLGHALTLALQDIAIRYHRLNGKRALFIPGADHAGFETQVVYEKQLAKKGKSRFDYSREELYAQIWDFVAENRENFESQFRRIGASVDWSRYTFTLDDKVIGRAYKTFKKMWNEGLIYRGERLVNFCTFHGTAFADIEVVHKEEQGKLWQLRYPLTDGSGDIVVATTRPETMFGDVAVAVHPDDERYKHLLGKTAKLPLTERELPIIADEFVDRNFGTGAVKITPGHDFNDFEVGQRHDLPKITVINNEGKMVEVPEAFRGLTVNEARTAVVKELEEQGYVVSVADHTHTVGHCYKCNTVIQPLLREQWFIDMQPLAQRTIHALEAGEVTFYPDSKRTQLIEYLKNLKDWNISRQITWGIPIPAFQNVDDKDDWIYDERVNQEIIEVNGKTYRRDSDVFDTWFSSGHWPIATLDYPNDKEVIDHYPLSLMETGGDILYPWVSRMLMLGLYVTDKVPFTAVYIHGYVRAEDGSKMSKSVGNVINPMPVIDQFGSDALRMGLVVGRAPAVNRPYDSRRVEEARNFCNKLWNVARFIEGLVGEDFTPTTPEPKTVADYWILYKLQHNIEGLTKELEEYRFSEGYERLYHLIWDDVADWYVEASKATPNPSVLGYVLETILTLAHPYAPFVTETIWQALGWRKDMLITYKWPESVAYDPKIALNFEQIKGIITEVRNVLAALKAKDVSLQVKNAPLLTENSELISRLARLNAVVAVEKGSGLKLTNTSVDAWLDIDKDTAKAYVDELMSKQKAQEQAIKQLEGRLANKAYVDKAPTHLVEQTKAQLQDAKDLLVGIEQEAERFKN